MACRVGYAGSVAPQPVNAYYNEHDRHAAAWLRELIAGGHIANGEVNERSIEDVTPADVMGFTQRHFFPGIGGWSLALRLAGWTGRWSGRYSMAKTAPGGE